MTWRWTQTLIEPINSVNVITQWDDIVQQLISSHEVQQNNNHKKNQFIHQYGQGSNGIHFWISCGLQGPYILRAELAIKDLFFQLSLWLKIALFFHLWIIYQVRFTYNIDLSYPAMNKKPLEEAE